MRKKDDGKGKSIEGAVKDKVEEMINDPTWKPKVKPSARMEKFKRKQARRAGKPVRR